jgi:hypothetical protein
MKQIGLHTAYLKIMCSGMWRCVAWHKFIDVSDERAVSIFRVDEELSMERSGMDMRRETTGTEALIEAIGVQRTV